MSCADSKTPRRIIVVHRDDATTVDRVKPTGAVVGGEIDIYYVARCHYRALVPDVLAFARAAALPPVSLTESEETLAAAEFLFRKCRWKVAAFVVIRGEVVVVVTRSTYDRNNCKSSDLWVACAMHRVAYLARLERTRLKRESAHMPRIAKLGKILTVIKIPADPEKYLVRS